MATKKEEKCPNCGYCPACGQAPPVIRWNPPYYYGPTYPWWQTVTLSTPNISVSSDSTSGNITYLSSAS